VRRVNRRLSLVLSVAVVATLTTGCSTFSDSNNIARVGDVALTDEAFQEQLIALGAPEDQLLPAEALRGEITTWIQEQITGADAPELSTDQVAARYDAGIDSSGAVCVNGIAVADSDTAGRVAQELIDGADFAETLAAENTDPGLDEVAGEIGCVTRDVVTESADIEFVQTIATLSADNPVGSSRLLDQLGNEFAWVVLTFRPFAELSPTDTDTVTTSIEGAAQLAAADVYVDPRYGTFDPTTGQVVALG
jgi:hypothetical protein